MCLRTTQRYGETAQWVGFAPGGLLEQEVTKSSQWYLLEQQELKTTPVFHCQRHCLASTHDSTESRQDQSDVLEDDPSVPLCLSA